MLFLAYGEFACLALTVKFFKIEMSTLISTGIGVIFTIMMAAWVIASMNYPQWFGSFKSRFRKY